MQGHRRLLLVLLTARIGALELRDLFPDTGFSAAIYGRAANTTTPIADGQVLSDSLDWGETAYWAYTPTNSTPATVYLTLNTCTQPDTESGLSNATAAALWQDPSQVPFLTLYGSNNTTIMLPSAAASTDVRDFQYGFANLTYTQNAGNLYFSVSAPPNVTLWANSPWTYQIGLSTSAPLHRALAGDQNRFLFLQDSDFSAALLTTGNLTSDEIPNYQIWVNPSTQSAAAGDVSASIQESLKWSWCGISQSSALVTLKDADRSMTTRGPGGLPKEQFYVHDLVPSTYYDSYITLSNNYTEGGTVWPVQTFRTRDNTTCQVIYNLDFCTEVAYSVPSNSSLYNPVALGAFYDSLASSYYANFTTSVQITNCNASGDAVYSLVSTCDDCVSAYKDWICAVTIPRCADLTNPASYLVYRNVSRNPAIDQALHPGPYKEVLPCADLVQSMTRKCPVVLNLREPFGSRMFDAAYGQRSDNATITCNAPGVDFWVASGNRASLCRAFLVLATVLSTMLI